MKKIENKNINEVYYFEKLENGLSVYLVPKKDYYMTYGILATHYGSFDQEFVPLNESSFYSSPLGVAHFLEHKVFECPNKEDASILFSRLGNESNAFTTYDTTAYMFSGTSHIDESIITLLDFVQNPCFTKKSIEKEKDIIKQELLMYLDKVGTVSYLGALNCLYKVNPIKNDIGGTIESIKEINKDILSRCYHTFYNPGNMILAIVGDIDVEKTITLIKENQSHKKFEPFTKIKRKKVIEPLELAKKEDISYLDITTPKVTIGLKLMTPKLSSIEKFKKSWALDMLMDINFSNSSSLYQKLKQEGIIDRSFGYESHYEEEYAFALISSDTLKQEEFISAIKNALLNIKDQPIKNEDFTRLKRVYIARVINKFNSIESIANMFVDLHYEDVDILDVVNIIDSITLDDLLELRSNFEEQFICVHKVLPLNKSKN